MKGMHQDNPPSDPSSEFRHRSYWKEISNSIRPATSIWPFPNPIYNAHYQIPTKVLFHSDLYDWLRYVLLYLLIDFDWLWWQYYHLIWANLSYKEQWLQLHRLRSPNEEEPAYALSQFWFNMVAKSHQRILVDDEILSWWF